MDNNYVIKKLDLLQYIMSDVRWKVTIKPRRRLTRRGSRVLFAYNYASVGVDAQVALDFHRARSQFLYRYTSRYLNYVSTYCHSLLLSYYTRTMCVTWAWTRR